MQFRSLLLFPLLATLSAVARGEVVINEVMYHPSSENPSEEYIELFNNGVAAVDVSGWRFTSGVSFTVPAATSIAPGGYLVVTANPTVFHAKYPAVVNYIASAGWSGKLSNSANNVVLENGFAAVMDSVSYSDDGDWAERQRDNPPDHGHRGWDWHSDADGFGKSLELINAAFDNDEGQNWASSATAQGTPGAANSVAAANIAPVIDKADHFPLVPNSADNVTVSCRVRDDHGAGLTAQLHYRDDGVASFTTAAMFDDGAHGDGAAGDGYFGALIAPKAAGTIVEFYFSASDETLTRTWPAPARDYTGTLGQTQNCLYQVDDTVYAGAEPLYRIILRAVDRTELSNINSDTGAPPFPYNPGETNDQTYSHAKFNATWLTHDGTGDSIVYLAGARNRGNGSRSTLPQNYNVSFRNSDTWKGATAINLNTQNTPYQLLGSAIFRKVGLTMAESRAVQVRVNGANLAGSGAPSYGFYVANEVQNSEFAAHHFPQDSSGNIYRGFRQDTVGGANLRDQSAGQPAATADPAPYRVNYFKETNASEDNWSDLIGLTKTLAKGTSVAASYTANYTADYVSAVQAAGDVAQWERFIAVNTIADNTETNIANGDGDDYYLYFGITDPRAVFISYDLDSIFGRSSGSDATHSLFRAARGDTTGNPPMPLHPFLIHPQFAREYLAEVKRLIDGPFSAAQFAELADETLGGVVNASVINAMKTFHNSRLAYIAGVMPLSLSSISATTTGGAALTITSGYPRSTAATCNLLGKADCTRTASVKVNGVTATYTPWKVTTVSSFATSIGDWQANNVALTPGLNHVLVQAFDATNAEIERTYFDVWYDDGSVSSVSGSIAANTTWTAAGGPYQVTAALTVASGAILTIQPGTTVYLGSGVGITVAAGGRILAEGTEALPIRFTRAPGVATNGGTITINGQGGVAETHFYHTFFEFGGDPAVVATANSNIVLDYCEWLRTDVSYLHLDGGSFVVSNCIFPSASASTFELVHGAAVPPAGGRAIIRDCFFGKAQQYNDVVDFTGGNRPGTIIQFLNNVFIGSDDDCLDLDGTDSWVEGNIFMHVHRNGSPDSSSAVSGGNDSGNTSQVTIVGNLFYDVDQAATGKQGNFYTFLQNTVVDQNGRGSADAVTGVLNFADTGIAEAAGMYAEGNIIHSATALVRNYPGTALANTVTFNNNLLPPGQAWSGLGSGNASVDPVLAKVQLVNPSAPSGGAYNIPTPTPRDYQRVATQIRAQFALGSGSPAKGTGPNGSDKGGVRPFGVTLGGAPVGTTNATTASITVGTRLTGNSIPVGTGTFPNGSGWTHYKWRLNGGAWSAETANTVPIALSGLTNGLKTLEVAGKNDAAFYQDDVAFGPDARISSVSWTVDTNYVPPGPVALVQISEVLARNTETLGFSGTFPDIIELLNAGTASADISGWGLTDNAASPYKYTIANGTTLAPSQRLVFYASSSNNVPAPKTGFALKDQGDTLTLTKSPTAGGGIADSVAFGAQIADLSVGRRETDGGWDMCRPTFGSANIVAAQAVPATVKINEWLADAEALFPNDFIELMNMATLPVNVGNCYLTDNPVEWPQHSQIRQLTFIAPGGYAYFKADNDPEQGPDHLNFKLASEQGEIGFFDSALNLIDSIVYGPQTSDISQGRTPNGASTIAFFTQPTPGAPNPGSTGGSTALVNLMPANKVWKYFANASAAPANDGSGRAYTDPLYNDAAWASGGGVLYLESNAFPANTDGFAKMTLLPGTTTTQPYQTYYFRTHFNFAGPLAGATLTATVMMDDGGIIYLNGHEILPTTGTRIRMNPGAVTYTTLTNGTAPDVSLETFTFSNSQLVIGDNVLVVEVHQPVTQSGGTPSSDITWGMKLDASVLVGTSSVVLNEVLPINHTLQNPDGSFAGWVELLNTSNTAVDISDLSLSNDLATPRKFVVPASTSIPANSYLVLYCNDLAAVSPSNTGFALDGTGGGVYLFRKLADGGGLQDSVSYGLQIADFALGRTPNGTGAFALTVPTRGTLNTAAGLGTISGVKLNEWLANPSIGPGFFELFNTGAQPVALGGNYLTDLLTNKTKHLIPTLSFIGGSGTARWRQFIADNDGGATPGHVNFSLNPLGESLGIFSGAGVQLDSVTFGAQSVDIAQGHYPDGTSAIVSLTPTPGGANVLAPTDTDGDGIPDAWEIANGLNPNNPNDANLDADGDGQSNISEYVAGTNPQSGASRLAAIVVPTATPGQVAVRFAANSGKTYTVRYKSDLAALSWLKLLDVPAQGADTLVDVTDPGSIGQPGRFYQVITPAQP